MNDNEKDDVIEGEEVTEVAEDSSETEETSFKINQGGSDQASAMLSLEELIKNHIDSIDKLREELKLAREMFEDSFANNPTYREHEEKVKEVTKSKNSVRQQIVKQPSVAALEQKVKDIRFDINEKGKTLSDLLQDYKEQTGATSIETRNGQVLEIVSTSKLVRSKGSK